MSNLSLEIAPPLSWTTNQPPFGLSLKYGIYITVPIGYTEPAANVYHSDAGAPDAVIPFVLPQQLIHGQYAEVLNVATLGVIPSTLFANVVEAVKAGFVDASLKVELLEVICLVLISTILSIGSLIISLEISVFSISILFWYFILYVISFKPSFPSCNTLFVVFSSEPVVFFVTVSYGIATCSTTIFSVIGA